MYICEYEHNRFICFIEIVFIFALVDLKQKIKIFISFSLLAVVLFAAVPKVYIHSILGHKHSSEILGSDRDTTVSEDNETRDCNFEKFDTPVYYTVFKFILNFLPLKETKQTSFFYKQESLPKLQNNSSLLRGPPMV